MKKLLFLFMLLGGVSSQAQQISYLDNNPKWYIESGNSFCMCVYDAAYFVDGDTVLNGVTWAKLYSERYYESGVLSTELFGAIMQEGKKLWFIQYSTSSSNFDTQLHLIADYDVTVGDTLHVDPFYNQGEPFIVDRLDSVLIGGAYRLAFIDSSWFYYEGEEFRYIEGLGHSKGLFEVGLLEGFSELKCYSLNGQKEFGWPVDDACQVTDRASISESQIPGISVFPNPSNGQFFIDAPEYTTYAVADLTGKVVQQGTLLVSDGNAIDLSNESSGVYVLTLGRNHQKYKLVKY